MIKQLTLFALLLILNSCGIFKSYEKYPKREFRGVWVATVVNIDWPKNGNDSAEKQKTDFFAEPEKQKTTSGSDFYLGMKNLAAERAEQHDEPEREGAVRRLLRLPAGRERVLRSPPRHQRRHRRRRRRGAHARLVGG